MINNIFVDNNVDSIIFDIDGTLWDVRDVVADAWGDAIRENTNLEVTFDSEVLGKLFGKPMDEIFHTLYPDEREEIINKIMPYLYDYEHRYISERKPQPYDGVKQTLSSLAKHYNLYIVTNAQTGYTENMLKATGLEEYFKGWMCYGDTLASKDIMICSLVEKYQLQSPIYVGDTQGDYVACKKAKVPFVYAEYGLGKVDDCIYSIKQISELVTKKAEGIELISRYRSELMGFAILWIVLFHTTMDTGISLLQAVKKFGYGGVDIFLMVSGLGIYYSLNKRNDSIQFYARRLKRLMPAYIPVLIVWLITEWKTVSMIEKPGLIVGNLTGINFWMDKPHFNWYIQVLPVIYLVSPLIYAAINGRKRNTVILFVSAVLLNFCFFCNDGLIAVSRIPIYIIGMICGSFLIENRHLTRKNEITAYVISFLSICGLILLASCSEEMLWNYGLCWYPFALITPGLVILLGRVFSLLDGCKAGRIVVRIIGYIGDSSYEIYLIQTLVFIMVMKYMDSNLKWIGLMTAVIVGGILYKNIFKFISKKVRGSINLLR